MAFGRLFTSISNNGSGLVSYLKYGHVGLAWYVLPSGLKPVG